MEEFSMKVKPATPPALWGFLGIALSGLVACILNMGFVTIESVLFAMKVKVGILKAWAIAYAFIAIVVTILIVLFCARRFGRPTKISTPLVIVLLVLWPVFSFGQDIFSFAITSKTYRYDDFHTISKYYSLRAAMYELKHVALVISIVVAAIYLLVRKASPTPGQQGGA